MTSVRTPDLDDLKTRGDERPDVAWWRSVAITAAGFTLALGTLGLIWLLARPLMLVLVAIIIASALMPIVERLERWVPRPVGVAAVYLVLIGIVGLVGWLVVPVMVREAQVLVTNAPETLAEARRVLNDFDPGSVDQVVSSAQSMADRFGQVMLSLPLTIFSSSVDVILVVFMSAYWLIEAPALKRFTLSLFRDERRHTVSGLLDEVGSTMGGFVRGTVIDAAIIAVITWIGLQVIGVQYPLVLAVVQGLGELIPIVGPAIAAIPALLVAVAHSPQQALIVLLFFIALQQMEGHLLLPLIMRQQADVPPLVSLVAVLAGSALGGLLGGIVAIPTVGGLRILLVRVLAPVEREWEGVEDAPTEVVTAEEEATAG